MSANAVYSIVIGKDYSAGILNGNCRSYIRLSYTPLNRSARRQVIDGVGGLGVEGRG